jgi:hypothetical protein
MAGAPNKVDKVTPSPTDVNKLFDHLSSVKSGKNSKIKWNGGRQELESFVKTALSLTGEWSPDDSTTPMFSISR